MASRVNPQYTPEQIIQKCSCITLDDLLNRDNTPRSLVFQLSIYVRSAEAYECSAHLLEWPDGCLVLVITKIKEFEKLKSKILMAAYRNACEGGLVYRDDFKND
jgi:hypothetical protein